ncbi:YcdB/YcdC domain-containing protein [Pontibacillus sp. HMF3514]|uniref:YcdB/YcdC domain-containing protein n=1 Tax=Pontibacillus sp. HMF3514 TaxID=2692425 RepID=UPI00131FF2D2|nr:S-layer homology domain-containing protein [Pontibacillus sp. HMF3514]QHE52386.1 hypothetical protein GS400_10215 [Pontibacillus sp. HMF3514]
MTYRIKKWGKLGVITLVPILSLSLLGQPAYAETSDSKQQQEPIHNVANPENVKFSKEQAIERVKELFPILEKGEVESVQLGQTNRYPIPKNQMVWEIDWRYAIENSSHGFSSKVDAMTGDILNVHIPSILTSDQPAYYPPKVTREEAKELAKQIIKKAAPNHTYDALLTGEMPYYTNDPLFGPIAYHFSFQPEVNGVPSPNERYHVEISGNGDLESFNVPSDSYEYPSPNTERSLSEATKRFKEDLNLQLSYITERINQEESKVYLGWKPNHEGSSEVIDAKTGEYLQANGDPLDVKQSTFKEIPEGEKVFEAVEPIKGERITAEQAANVVTNAVNIPEGKQLQRTSLREDGSWNYKKPVWHLTWMEPGAFGYENEVRAYVDAKTGQLVEVTTRSLRPGTNSIEIDEEESLTKEEITQLALSKIQSLYPNATEELKWKLNKEASLYSSHENVVSFQFQRYLNDIPVQNDRVTMTYSLDGELIHYNVQQTPQLEEKVSELQATISKGEARETYLKHLKAELQYNLFREGIGEDGTEQIDMKLVYKRTLQDVPHQYVVLDAETGKWRSLYRNNGVEQTYNQPTNLNGHWAKDELMTLAKHKILQVNDAGEINPSDTITYGKWLQMISKAIEPNYKLYMERNIDQEESINKENEFYAALMFADGREWLDEEISQIPVEKVLTREQLAESVVNILQYDKIATFMNQESKFSDITNSSNKGAIHVVQTLGIMQGNHGKFYPNASVTKAEAAVVMMRMVKLQDKLDQEIRDERY